MQVTCDILLVAVNARYSHCAYAARALQANLGDLEAVSRILETDLDVTPWQLASMIVEAQPRIAGFSVYLWNVRLIESVARILRAAAPRLLLVAGGPELTAAYANAPLFDAVILGEGESAFRAFCEQRIGLAAAPDAPGWAPGPSSPQPRTPCDRGVQMIAAAPENPATLGLPYRLYTDADLAQRTVYVEASRGCPYACAYCTSADTGLRLLPLERLLPAFDDLWRRGLRRFKFLDRSFNAPVEHAGALLDFFLARVTPETRLHFEINADQLHPVLAAKIAAFPDRVLHLEVGIQTLNPDVAAAIGRSANTPRTLENLRFLTRQTGATVHADLIFGLPGETAGSFADGFNTVIEQCDPPELQVNLLKGLPGTRLVRDATRLGLVFNPEPPYELLCSAVLPFGALTQLQRFARCWELVHNRNRFPRAVRALHASCGNDFFTAYQTLAERIHAGEGKLFALGLPRLAGHLLAHLTEHGGLARAEAETLLAEDLNAKPS